MTLNITIPVYNGEAVLAASIRRLHAFATNSLPFHWQIVIANNGSTDETLHVAHALEQEMARINVLNLVQKGRGRALRASWQAFPGDVLSYMDVDLSTDLNSYPALIHSILSRGYDVATGSRLLSGSTTIRCLKREVISRTYNMLLKVLFGTNFSDAQCGFKALSAAAGEQLLELVEDQAWFFDTELLVVAEKLGYRVFDIPVPWTENRDTRVRILTTVFADIKGIIRLRRSLARTCVAAQGAHKHAFAALPALEEDETTGTL